MSYSFAGKIAGLGLSRGFGDAASDYAADHAAWLNEKAAYDRAVQAFTAQSAALNAGYSQAQQAYQRDLAAWNNESATRAAQIVASGQQQLRNQVARDRANAAAKAAGVVLPAGYSGCVTQAQHDSWQANCLPMNMTVKGLGAASPTGSFCALALLPVCQPAPALPAPLRPKPTPPAPPSSSLTPPPALRAEPLPPVLNTAPQTIPSSLTPAPAQGPKKSAGLLSNGLILIVLAGGSYALYRTLRKPKASS